jgi:hypothetical protein
MTFVFQPQQNRRSLETLSCSKESFKERTSQKGRREEKRRREGEKERRREGKENVYLLQKTMRVDWMAANWWQSSPCCCRLLT